MNLPNVNWLARYVRYIATELTALSECRYSSRQLLYKTDSLFYTQAYLINSRFNVLC